MYLFIWMFCDSENLPSLVDLPQSQFKSRYTWGKLEGFVSRFDRTHAHTHTHTQFRRGSCSELSCLISEGILSVTSEWMKPVVFLHSYVFHPWSAGIIITLRIYIFVVVSGTPLHYPRLLTPIVHPLMWCSWLFFLIICQLSYTTVFDWSQSGMSPSEFGSCINGYIWLCKCRPIWIPPSLSTWNTYTYTTPFYVVFGYLILLAVAGAEQLPVVCLHVFKLFSFQQIFFFNTFNYFQSYIHSVDHVGHRHVG
jgi:hypothetical protein